MAIQNPRELEVVMQGVLITVDRLLLDQPRNGALAQASRDLRDVASAVKKGEKLGPMLQQKLARGSGVVRQAAGGDDGVFDQLLDIADYLETLKG